MSSVEVADMAEVQIVVFAIANERYGVDVTQVQSIERMMELTRVPKTLGFIKGVVNLRGVVTPVIDLRDRFGFPALKSATTNASLSLKLKECKQV